MSIAATPWRSACSANCQFSATSCTATHWPKVQWSPSGKNIPAAGHVHSASARLKTRTLHSAWRMTRSATEPKNIRLKPW